MPIDIDSLTVKELRELTALACNVTGKPAKAAEAFPFKVGDCVFIRTVTHHQTGRIAAIGRDWIKLDDAAWIADDGRFSDAMRTGVFAEVEPMPSWCMVGRGAIIDMLPWPHALPREKK